MKSEKGITLIALVVTVLVLIILSSVAVRLSVGDQGVIKAAEETKNDTINSINNQEQKLNELRQQLEQ